VRTHHAAADVAVARGCIGAAGDPRNPFARPRRRGNFLRELLGRHFAVEECVRHAPVDAELSRNARFRRTSLRDVAPDDVVRLGTHHDFHPIDFVQIAPELRAQLERCTDGRMRQAARRIGLDRELIKFVSGAQLPHRAIAVETVVQIDTCQAVFTSQRMRDALQAAARHQRGGHCVRRCKARLDVLCRGAFTR
jgi:hypothetical protein